MSVVLVTRPTPAVKPETESTDNSTNIVLGVVGGVVGMAAIVVLILKLKGSFSKHKEGL